ncbi:hypothetical protein EWM64_g1860 [Hericium alpestre]|uniref:NADP-dependent oxidoreductase domain-containing protein n=1 Tax=Hericium alpestre TaxID=135208 RepID=A0A4Z0A890_9AGAM|nr:hypothetical protein EWM64_g1860 [Hericium alpestre]
MSSTQEAEAQVPPKRNMQYVNLGKSGLKVSRIILGCMSYGSPEWFPWLLGEKEGLEHIKAAYDAGIQTFDTADVYSHGLSEVILGKAIKRYNFPREEIVVMTKISGLVTKSPGEKYFQTGEDPKKYGYVNQSGLSRKHVFEGVKHCLERLQLDYVDVLQCHRFDPNTPISEVMHALHDVVQAGHVRYIGMSSCYAWQFFAMQSYAIEHGLTSFISMQNHYNMLYREEEREMMPTLRHFGVGSIPWSPLARGLLTRPLGSQKTARGDFDPWHKLYLNEHASGKIIIKRVEELAAKKGHSMAQIALAWMLTKDVVSAPIMGTTSLKNLHDILGALDVKLDEDEVKYLDEAYLPLPVLGHT